MASSWAACAGSSGGGNDRHETGAEAVAHFAVASGDDGACTQYEGEIADIIGDPVWLPQSVAGECEMPAGLIACASCRDQDPSGLDAIGIRVVQQHWYAQDEEGCADEFDDARAADECEVIQLGRFEAHVDGLVGPSGIERPVLEAGTPNDMLGTFAYREVSLSLQDGFVRYACINLYGEEFGVDVSRERIPCPDEGLCARCVVGDDGSGQRNEILFYVDPDGSCPNADLEERLCQSARGGEWTRVD